MEQSTNNPYDFIVNNGPPKKRSLLSVNNTKQKIIFVLIGGILLIVIALLVTSFISKGSKENTVQLLQISASQQDIIELTALASTNSRTTNIINQSSTTGLVVNSQANSFNVYLAKKGIKNNTKTIKIYRDTNFKKSLEDAKTQGKFDETYIEIYANRLDDYRAKLQAAYSSAKSNTLKKIMSDSYSQLSLIASKNN